MDVRRDCGKPPPGGGLRRVPASQLNVLAAERPAPAPADPRAPAWASYCHHPGCSLREVKVTAKFDRPPRRPPGLNCPACGRPLEFLHYLEEITLRPAACPLGLPPEGGVP